MWQVKRKEREWKFKIDIKVGWKLSLFVWVKSRWQVKTLSGLEIGCDAYKNIEKKAFAVIFYGRKDEGHISL